MYLLGFHCTKQYQNAGRLRTSSTASTTTHRARHAQRSQQRQLSQLRNKLGTVATKNTNDRIYLTGTYYSDTAHNQHNIHFNHSLQKCHNEHAGNIGLVEHAQRLNKHNRPNRHDKHCEHNEVNYHKLECVHSVGLILSGGLPLAQLACGPVLAPHESYDTRDCPYVRSCFARWEALV